MSESITGNGATQTFHMQVVVDKAKKVGLFAKSHTTKLNGPERAEVVLEKTIADKAESKETGDAQTMESAFQTEADAADGGKVGSGQKLVLVLGSDGGDGVFGGEFGTQFGQEAVVADANVASDPLPQPGFDEALDVD